VSTMETGVAVQPRARLLSPILVAMVALCAVGARSMWQENAELTIGLGPGGIAAWVAWAVYGLVAVLIVVALQRFAHRPAWGVLLALAWGAFAATWAAEAANGAMSSIFLRTVGTDPHAWLSTPVVEESMKALGVLGLVLIPVLRRIRTLDGLFYGVLVGVGFQVFEDAIFTVTALFHDPTNPMGDILGNLILRGFTVGLFTHAVYTGVVGAAIGWVACSPAGERGRRVGGALLVFVLAMATHGLFNTQDSITPLRVGVAIVPFLVLLVVIRYARRDEVAFLATEARAQDGWGSLSADDIALMDGPRPATKDGRRLRDQVLTFAWAADRLGADSQQGQRAAEKLAVSRSRTA
jgi:RsiW-degrading membrane proteinase PrsW (M82 family)